MPQLCKTKKLIDSPIIFINAGRFSQWASEQGPAHPALQESLPQVSLPGHTAKKSDLCTPRKETAWPQSQFLHSCVCERLLYSHDRSAYSGAGKYVNRSWEYIDRSQARECGNWFLRPRYCKQVSGVSMMLRKQSFGMCLLLKVKALFKKVVPRIIK